MLFGYPRYNILECHDYLKKKLTDNGFIVYDINPYKLFISWDHISCNKKYISYPKKIEDKPIFKKTPVKKKKIYEEQTIQYRDINDQISTNELFS